MLLHCPTCQSQIDASALAPGATASCPVCHGVFQVPGAASLGLPPSDSASHSGRSHSRLAKPASSLASTLTWALVYLCVFVLIGAGAGLLAFHFLGARKEHLAAPGAPPAVPEQVDQPPEAAPQTPPVAKWKKLGYFTGIGMYKTPVVSTSSRRWRIHWSAKPLSPDSADNFAIIVTDRAGKQLQTPVSIVGAGGDTAELNMPPGRYVLEIFTFQTSWEVTAEEPE